MPLKGVVLQQTVYPDPAQRRITDVDLLVPPERFDTAVHVLEQDGFAPAPALHTHECVMRAPELPLAVDLHAHVFAPGRYRMPTSTLFERARADCHSFQARVWMPDPYDTFGHLIGHFAADHSDHRDVMHLEDLRRLPPRFELDPETCARRLHEHGLARAARYTLGFVAEASSDAFASKVLRALPYDPVGDILANAASYIVRRSAPHSRAGTLPAHLLNHSIPAAIGALGSSLIQKTRVAMRGD